jgi:CHAT domain-containing protein
MTYGLRAIDAVESLHTHLDAERLGPAWSARTQDIYAKLAVMMLGSRSAHESSAKLWAALEVIERSRAISLRQQFNAPLSVRKQVEQSGILATLSEIANESAVPGQKELPLAYYHQHDLLTLSRLAGAGDLPVPPPWSAGKLQGALNDKQTVLYYFFANDQAYLFSITHAGIALFELGSKSNIDAGVARLRDAIASRNGMLVESLRDLSAALLPAAAFTAAGEWIVVRDGSLHGVPFSALHVGSAAGPYDPAIARHAVKMVPSLSAYFMRKSVRPAEYQKDLAVFADPAFGVPDGRLTHKVNEGAGQFVGWTKTLRRLPWTAREAQGLQALFPPNRTLVYTGSRATRENLRNALVRDARVLHIASHGYFRSDDPDNVGFALAATQDDAKGNSGFITLAELFTYRFNNELVVISGCDTALGLERGGEGMMSLTRGFIAQGASHVVSTLWAVSDQASAEFMAVFYARLVERGAVTEALRDAQREIGQRVQYQSPFYWAPYTLTTVEPDEKMLFPRSGS